MTSTPTPTPTPTAPGAHLPAGSTTTDAYELAITPAHAGWAYSSLRILRLAPGQQHSLRTVDEEFVVLALAGSCTIACDGQEYELRGRPGVFAGISDMVYLPRDAEVSIASEQGGRFALPSARCDHRLAPRYQAAENVPVEIRGAGACSRQVNNVCAADTFDADRLIVVEVLTPSGNWSSYPPHKHDEDQPGRESVLEEIYYFEVAPGPEGPGVGYHRVYGSPDRPIDVTAEVRTGDVVLVPHGWHGPSMAAPGYHLYYLNVMAGPSAERAWLIQDDPDHAWIRDTWNDQRPDPRLPLARADDDRRKENS